MEIIPVTVEYRRFPEGDVIALFVDVDEGEGRVASYQHMGQHGVAARALRDSLELAIPEQFGALHSELWSIGYAPELAPAHHTVGIRRYLAGCSSASNHALSEARRLMARWWMYDPFALRAWEHRNGAFSMDKVREGRKHSDAAMEARSAALRARR